MALFSIINNDDWVRGIFTINFNGCIFTKELIPLYVRNGATSFAENGHVLLLADIVKFVNLFEENNKCELIFDNVDGVDGIFYENNILIFEFTFYSQSNTIKIEINENNKQQFLNMFNDFNEWCKNLIETNLTP